MSEPSVHETTGLQWTGVYLRYGSRGVFNALTSQEVYKLLDEGTDSDQFVWHSIVAPDGTVYLAPNYGGDLEVWTKLGAPIKPAMCEESTVVYGDDKGYTIHVVHRCDLETHSVFINHQANSIAADGTRILISWSS